MAGDTILGVGSHEPILHRIRTGNAAADEWQRWERETSPENLDLLERLGVGHVHVACTKGFGLEVEKPIIERAAKLREACSRRGIRLSIYVQGLPVYYETFLLERPEAQEWFARTQSGDYMPWNGQTFRRWMDPHCEEFLDYQRNLIGYAVRTVQPDAVFIDNTVMPWLSYTERSRRAFRAYLQAKFDEQDLMRLFGIPSFEAVDLPRFDPVSWPPDAYRIVKDPLLQELAFWRAETYARWVGEIRKVVKEAQPEARFATTCGCDGLRYNHLFNRGIDFDLAIRASDDVHMEESGWRPGVFFDRALTAEPASPDDLDAPRVSTDARWHKIIGNYGRSRGFGFWGEFDEVSQQIAAAHGMAFAGRGNDFGTVGPLAADPRMLDHLRPVVEWAQAHADVLTNRDERLAEIGLWRSTATCGFVRHTPVWAACAIEQMLFENHLPFTILLDGSLAEFLTGRRGLILPMTSCISDEQAALIVDFVQQGGGLLLLGDAGTRDERTRVRARHALAPLLPADALQEIEQIGPPHFVPEVDMSRLNRIVRAEAGRGRVSLVPRVTPQRPLDLTRDPYSPWRQVAPKDILPPANEAEILSELLWVLGERDILRAEGPWHTLCEFWRQGDDLLVCAANLHPHADGGPFVLHLPGVQKAAAEVSVLFERERRPLEVADGKCLVRALPRFVAIKVPGAIAKIRA